MRTTCVSRFIERIHVAHPLHLQRVALSPTSTMPVVATVSSSMASVTRMHRVTAMVSLSHRGISSSNPIWSTVSSNITTSNEEKALLSTLKSVWESDSKRPRTGICVSVFRQPSIAAATTPASINGTNGNGNGNGNGNANKKVITYHEVLLVKRGKAPAVHQWALPGGSIEWGETLRQAAIREVKEECDIEIGVAGAELGRTYYATDAIFPKPPAPVEYHYGLIHMMACVPYHASIRAMTDAAQVRWVRLPVDDHGILQASPMKPVDVDTDALPYLYLDWLELAPGMHEVATAAVRMLHRPSSSSRHMWLSTYSGPLQPDMEGLSSSSVAEVTGASAKPSPPTSPIHQTLSQAGSCREGTAMDTRHHWLPSYVGPLYHQTLSTAGACRATQ